VGARVARRQDAAGERDRPREPQTS
jgi:hypothetical protein